MSRDNWAPVLLTLAVALVTISCNLFSSGLDDSGLLVTTIASPVAEATAPDLSESGVDPLLSTATPTVSAEDLEQAFDMKGSVTANLDGEPRIWRTGSIEVEGEQVDLSSWYRAPLQTIPDLYNFDIYAVPEETFTEGADAEVAQASGAALTISFSQNAPQAGQTVEFALPASEGLTSAAVGYIGVEGEQYNRFEMSEGRLEVTLVSVTPGEPAVLEGTFEGTLIFAGQLGDLEAQTDPSRSFQISEGKFSVETLRYDPIFDQ